MVSRRAPRCQKLARSLSVSAMRCTYCGLAAVGIVAHRGPDGRSYRDEIRDPVCATHRIRLDGYWESEREDLPPETLRDAIRRILTEKSSAPAREISDILHFEGAGWSPNTIWTTLQKEWVRGTLDRKKSRGSPGRWTARSVWWYSLSGG